MATKKRMTLRDREATAIAGADDAPTTAVDDAPTADEVHEVKSTQEGQSSISAATRGSRSTGGKKPAAAPTMTGETTRFGIYFKPEEFEAAKSAYLADFAAGGEADSFARWIAAVLDQHAGRTPEERAALARPVQKSKEPTGGFSRTFVIPSSVLYRVYDAIEADRATGRWATDSGWAGDAAIAAVDIARARGPLPPAPARLPNRLRRR